MKLAVMYKYVERKYGNFFVILQQTLKADVLTLADVRGMTLVTVRGY
jgi:hypothetical protein